MCKGLIFFFNLQIIFKNILEFIFSGPGLKIALYIASFSNQKTFSIFQFLFPSFREGKGKNLFSYLPNFKTFLF